MSKKGLKWGQQKNYWKFPIYSYNCISLLGEEDYDNILVETNNDIWFRYLYLTEEQ